MAEREISPGAFVELLPSFFSKAEGDKLLTALQQLPFEQRVLQLHNKTINEPHLTLWVGDAGARLKYTGLKLEPYKWTPELQLIRERVQTHLGVRYQGALLNLYRDGKDYIGWHSDKRTAYGAIPTIASVSFGAARRFLFQSKKHKSQRIEYRLPHGSLLVMRGRCQDDFKHTAPKEKCEAVRINLTFRLIQVPPDTA